MFSSLVLPVLRAYALQFGNVIHITKYYLHTQAPDDNIRVKSRAAGSVPRVAGCCTDVPSGTA